jgi:branched-chain amino acid transport system ATP-binding protein
MSVAAQAVASPLLKVEGLTIRFGGLTAVNNVSFELNSGELIGLIGPNGAGKTTCFNMLTGVYIPTSGKIEFNGRSIVGVAPHKICQLGASRTFQNIRLFKEMTVMENILVSLHPDRGYGLFAAFLRLPGVSRREKKLCDEALAILSALGLADKAQALAKNLPYGDQRKVEIARALATHPKLLLLDEPAAGMNPIETAQLCEFILKIRNDYKLTILLIEHDMSLVMKICERIYVLDYGELIASGQPNEIKSNKRVIEAYLGSGMGSETGAP